VAGRGLVLDVGRADRDAARFLFRGFVDLVEGDGLGLAPLGEDLKEK